MPLLLYAYRCSQSQHTLLHQLLLHHWRMGIMSSSRLGAAHPVQAPATSALEPVAPATMSLLLQQVGACSLPLLLELLVAGRGKEQQQGGCRCQSFLGCQCGSSWLARLLAVAWKTLLHVYACSCTLDKGVLKSVGVERRGGTKLRAISLSTHPAPVAPSHCSCLGRAFAASLAASYLYDQGWTLCLWTRQSSQRCSLPTGVGHQPAGDYHNKAKLCAVCAETWQLTYLPNAAYPNTYNVIDLTRTACYEYLAAYPCGYPTKLSTFESVSLHSHAKFCMHLHEESGWQKG